MIYSFYMSENDINVFKELNINLEAILRELKIPFRSLQSGKFTLTKEQYIAAYESIGKNIPRDSVLRLSLIESKNSFAPAIFAGLCADNALNCIRRIVKYKKIVAPYILRLEEGERSTSITFEMEGNIDIPFFAVLYEQVNILSIIRKGTGKEAIKPISVEMNDVCPDNIAEYFGLEPKVSPINRITFDNEDLKKVFITENNNMWDYLEEELNKRLKEVENDKSFSALVRKILFELIPSGVSDIGRIASELGISKRTVQRKLKDDGTTFNEQLIQARELLVRNYLTMDMTLDEIAFFVNYADAKSLSRAFKTWTGMSVSEYRNMESLH